MNELSDKIDRIASRVRDQLIDKLGNDHQFTEREFYAKSFLVAVLLEQDTVKHQKLIESLLKSINSDQKGKTYHFEFNIYALLHHLQPQQIDGILSTRKFTGVRVANWFLLRAICRRRRGFIQKLIATTELAIVRALFVHNHSIEDRRFEYTSQYNFFSLALIHELRATGINFWSQKWLRAATEKCIVQINSHGVVNLLGRGAMQSFGYCSLINLLSFYSCDAQVTALIDTLLERVEKEIEKSEKLPLVMFKPHGEPFQYKGKPDLSKQEFLGWYSYNNAADYEAFSAFMLLKAKRNLLSRNHMLAPSQIKNEFVEVARDIFAYNADTTVYFGSPYLKSNSLGAYNPVVVHRADIVFPPLGGEQQINSLNNNSDFGIPIVTTHDGKEIHCSRIKVTQQRKNSIKVQLNFNDNTTIIRKIVCRKSGFSLVDAIFNTKNEPTKIDSMRLIFSPEWRSTISVKVRGNKTEAKLCQRRIYSTGRIDEQMSVTIDALPASRYYVRATFIP